MSDKDLVSRKRVLARKKTMHGWSSGEEEVVSVEYIESIPPVKQPMSAVEYCESLERALKTRDFDSASWNNAMLCHKYAEAVAIVEKWAREHPEETTGER